MDLLKRPYLYKQTTACKDWCENKNKRSGKNGIDKECENSRFGAVLALYGHIGLVVTAAPGQNKKKTQNPRVLRLNAHSPHSYGYDIS